MKLLTANGFKHTWRPLWKHPGWYAMIVLILAVGIGLGCGLYSVAEALLLRPLPFDNPDQLVDIEQRMRSDGMRVMTTQQHLDDLAKLSATLEDVATYQHAFGAITVTGTPEYAEGMKVDHHFFPLLDVEPALGREFTAENEEPGAPGTIVLSHIYWQRRFSSNPNAIGKSILLNGRPYSIIGVMPQLFYFPFLEISGEEDFWIPLQQNPEERSERGDKYGLARLKPGATLQQAQAEVAQLGRQISPLNSGKSFYFHLRRYHDVIVEGMQPVLLLLIFIIVCIQLMVCVNVANLLLVDAVNHRKEIEIRFALGGTRWQIARLFLFRGIALGLAGGIAGAGLAYGTVFLVRKLLPSGFPGAQHITLNASLLWITALVAVGSGIFFALWPALVATQKLHSISLHQAGSASKQSFATRSMRKSRKTLVALQLAFSSAFLIMTVLLGISLFHLLNVDLGMRIDHRLVMGVMPSDPSLKKDEATLQQFYGQIRRQLAAMPGVAAVTISSDAPLTAHGTRPFRIRNEPSPSNSQEWKANTETIEANYFQVLEMLVLKGRSFDDEDRTKGMPVAIVNEAFAKRFFGDVSPIGKQICIGTGDRPWREIVGVAANAREARVDSPPEPTCYVPFGQAQEGFLASAAFIVDTSIAPAALIRPIQRKMRELAPGDSDMGPITLEEMRSRQLMGARYSVWFLATIASLALLLAAMGVFGVITGDVEQRRREIGIRTALGATPKNIATLFLRQLLFMLIPGLLLGLGIAAMLVRYTSSFLFGITPIDPVAYSVVVLVLTVVAALSTALPVRRALRTSPANALREE